MGGEGKGDNKMILEKKFYEIKTINDRELLDIKFKRSGSKDNYNVLLELTENNAIKADELEEIELEENDIGKTKEHKNNFGKFVFHQIKPSALKKYGFDIPTNLEKVLSRIHEINSKKQAG